MGKLFIANWKENPMSEKEAISLAKTSDSKSVVVCPPNIFLIPVAKVLKNAVLGAQDAFYEASGPYTGEVSMAQIKELGGKYVIVGHSKRRELGESDSVVAHKVVSAFEAGLIPIVCVGETAEEKIAGKTKEVVDRQLRSAFSLLVAGMEKGGVAYVAYEPVWSISTNQKAGLASTVDTPSSAQTVVRYLEGVARGMPIEIRFLYGGSVDSKNLASFLACPEFQGVLVGGASLKPTEVKAMTEIVESFH